MRLHYVWVIFRKIFQLIIKKTGLYGYVYDFSVDYDIIDVTDILDIHKYLIVKNNMKLCSALLNKYLLHY